MKGTKRSPRSGATVLHEAFQSKSKHVHLLKYLEKLLWGRRRFCAILENLIILTHAYVLLNLFYTKQEPIWQMAWPVSNVTNHITASILHTVHQYESGQGW